MAQTMLGAMLELVRQSPSGQSVEDRVFVGQAPEGTDLPLIVLKHGGEIPDWSFEETVIENGVVEIQCYAVGLKETEALAADLKQALDWTDALDVELATKVKVERTNYLVDATDDRDASGLIVFAATLRYAVSFAVNYKGGETG